ncbi:hypothetical protein ACZ11_12575 [Lysinibacillus xylanilyticus]|uniref:Transposase n=1 Tax=Lysinibacillus xylanilyticus TaxID=582475 RepID=A0A0K9FEI4_9BACI|nr:hypothetical protein ACZ11_12575 [Lysinibacillus xylanilyticus]
MQQMIDFPTTMWITQQTLHFGKSVADNAWGMFTTFLRYKLEEQGKKHHVGQKPIQDAIMPRLCQYNKRKSKFPRKHYVYTEMVHLHWTMLKKFISLDVKWNK